VEAARRHAARLLLVEYPDRLAPFGFAYSETLFDVLNVRIVVVSHQEPEDAQAELVKDMLSVVTSFSAKLNGMRGGRKAWAAVKAALAETEGSVVGG